MWRLVVSCQSDGVPSPELESGTDSPISISQIIVSPLDLEEDLPETERYSVILTKNETGLGITIAGKCFWIFPEKSVS